MPAKNKVLVMLGWKDPRIIRAISQYAHDAGWQLETRNFFSETIPLYWRGQGFIVGNSERADVRAFIRRQAAKQHTVLVSRQNPGIHVPQVLEANHTAGQLAARHFIALGHKNFAWFNAYHGQTADARRNGFQAALTAAGFKCQMLEYRRQRQPLADWMAARLRSLPRPLACYVLDDPSASDLIDVCLANGWRVPEDIAVLGNGNLDVACECAPVPVSSVDLNEEEVGRQAVVLLDRLMRGAKPPAQPILIEPRGVVVRQSTDYIAVSDPVLRVAVDYITSNLHQPFSLEQVAAAAGISRRTLYNLFRRHLRRTPVEFVLRSRLARAQKLLATPGQTVTNVAALCGLGSTRTLTRLFRRHTGANVRAWKQHQKTVGGQDSVTSVRLRSRSG